MALETYPFDGADALDTPQAQAELLAEALESGNANAVAAALRIITRARGMAQVAKDAGISRETLYKATGPDANPTLETLFGIMRATGLKLSAAA